MHQEHSKGWSRPWNRAMYKRMKLLNNFNTINSLNNVECNTMSSSMTSNRYNSKQLWKHGENSRKIVPQPNLLLHFFLCNFMAKLHSMNKIQTKTTAFCSFMEFGYENMQFRCFLGNYNNKNAGFQIFNRSLNRTRAKRF